jgi:tRNA threonylcarbamoyladenosine biosynthesis protein TsaE
MREGERTLDIVSRCAEDTLRLGEVLGRCLQAGDVVALVGELGSGKTCMTQGIARGLGVPPGYPVTSPTFTLINEYPGTLALYHLDIYRLTGPIDLEDLGYEEYFYGDGVVVIEWAEKIEELLPREKSHFIHLRYVDENTREIRISGPAGRVTGIRQALIEGGFI